MTRRVVLGHIFGCNGCGDRVDPGEVRTSIGDCGPVFWHPSSWPTERGGKVPMRCGPVHRAGSNHLGPGSRYHSAEAGRKEKS